MSDLVTRLNLALAQREKERASKVAELLDAKVLPEERERFAAKVAELDVDLKIWEKAASSEAAQVVAKGKN